MNGMIFREENKLHFPGERKVKMAQRVVPKKKNRHKYKRNKKQHLAEMKLN